MIATFPDPRCIYPTHDPHARWFLETALYEQSYFQRTNLEKKVMIVEEISSSTVDLLREYPLGQSIPVREVALSAMREALSSGEQCSCFQGSDAFLLQTLSALKNVLCDLLSPVAKIDYLKKGLLFTFQRQFKYPLEPGVNQVQVIHEVITTCLEEIRKSHLALYGPVVFNAVERAFREGILCRGLSGDRLLISHVYIALFRALHMTCEPGQYVGACVY